ncbi:MAG: hypothetical protein J5867_04215 [Prevotella sp.]|nr:hypothetical protein [Prevotella sp.]MBQ6062365.1 hypothetical protein [Prevotella sp.]MBQ6210111.1 hypothetical protein [Prevotella sp.]
MKSTFSKAYLRTTFLIISFVAIVIVIVFLFQRSWIYSFLMGFYGFVFLMVWELFTLKTITIEREGLEIKRTFLPFIKRYYRFNEFDYAQTNKSSGYEKYQLIRNGERVVTISSEPYSNYAALKKAIPVRNKKHFSPRTQEAVASLYNKTRLWCLGGLYGITTLFVSIGCIAMDIPLVIVAMSFLALICWLTLLLFLSHYKKIVIWNGQIEVRRLLWPFKLHIYKISEIDGYYRVTVYNGRQDEERWWLVKSNKLLLSISQSVYKNYDALTSATQTKCLGSLEISDFQSLKYRLFNKKL